MSDLKARLIKNSTIDFTASLEDSKIYGKKDMIPTAVPMINIALSGSMDGGITPGLTVLAAPSKHFKTAFSLLMGAAYLKKYPEGIILFYDSEFGTPESYFAMFGVPLESVVHTPITDIEELKFDIMRQLKEIKRNDKVMIIIDSVGNLASKKEVEDAEAGKSVGDMTRAKQLKSLFRMVTPHLTLKDIPMVVVNHIYMEQSLYPKAIVSGGCMIEDTKIRLDDGNMIEIQNAEVGMKVKTLNGSRLISAVWNPSTLFDGEPECYEIEFEDGSKYVCSEEHMFKFGDNWVEINQLKVGDDVVSVE